ncbi:MAG: ShlB/FhaC/HecB family hemolysin secretion/activation protein [Sedimentisphaerales bacterium]|nr:ShlB/FhaC/HecB family hemolysin secretion/activation protein [Sedimentisphaerales bacterium]
MSSTKTILCFVLVFVLGSICCLELVGAERSSTEPDPKIEQMRDQAKKTQREAHEKAKAKLEQDLSEIDLPEDKTRPINVKEILINGNTLLTTDELLADMPLIFNDSAEPLKTADSSSLYDFRVLHEIILDPGEVRQITTRTIRAFTQYVVSAYRKKGYAGIYVYIPSDKLTDGEKFKDDVMYVQVLEASVSTVRVKQYDIEQNVVEKGYLSRDAVLKWSPIKEGQIGNQKKLDDFVNLLNLNPDRYVSAVVTQGDKADTLTVAYDIYETDPWHYFLQVDNSGTRDRQWTPRFGIINTNLLGIDDKFTAIVQAPPESGIEDNYSIYGSYDIPIMGPKLRLNLYGGYSEYDINPETGIFNFLGNGSFVGGILRLNTLQWDGWFFDLLGSMSYERSKITPSLFPDFLGTSLHMAIWGVGADIHRSTDMEDASVTFNRYTSFDGSDSSEFNTARTNADNDFTIYNTTASYSRFLDTNQVQRAGASFRHITSSERLVPAKMTTFGGMYTVRGYDEYEIVADGGILATAQYEFDLIKYDKVMKTNENSNETTEPDKYELKKLAPLVFFDYGRMEMQHPVAGERRHQTLASVGVGTLFEIGDNFSGGVYYGYPLRRTDDTRRGKGRVNVGFLLRW